MSELQNWTEEDEAKLNEALGDEVKEEEEKEPEETEEEEIKEEPKEEKPAEKPPEKEAEPVDNRGWAKLRWEKAEAERKAAELEAENQRLKNPPVDLPSKEENYEGHMDAKLTMTEKDIQELKEWKTQQEQDRKRQEIFSGAIQEFTEHETKFKESASDYDKVADHLKGRIADSIRMLNPHLTDKAIQTQTTQEILRRASIADQQGLNPAKALYDQGKAAGYVEQEEEKPQKSKLSIVAENKKKSTNMLGTGGGGKPENTLQSVANAPQSEMAKLSEAELDKLIYGS